MGALAAIKEYRTPQALRAFAHVYIPLIGILYGPYYVVRKISILS